MGPPGPVALAKCFMRGSCLKLGAPGLLDPSPATKTNAPAKEILALAQPTANGFFCVCKVVLTGFCACKALLTGFLHLQGVAVAPAKAILALARPTTNQPETTL